MSGSNLAASIRQKFTNRSKGRGEDFQFLMLRYAYDRETVVAEKLEATVSLGTANSRMKDFYDIATLAQGYSFEGGALLAAIVATFERRDTAMPSESLVTLLEDLRSEPHKAPQWKAFMKIQAGFDPTVNA